MHPKTSLLISIIASTGYRKIFLLKKDSKIPERLEFGVPHDLDTMIISNRHSSKFRTTDNNLTNISLALDKLSLLG